MCTCVDLMLIFWSIVSFSLISKLLCTSFVVFIVCCVHLLLCLLCSGCMKWVMFVVFRLHEMGHVCCVQVA